jgi:hypothetical protein
MNGPVADLITPDHRDRFATAHAIVRGGRPWCRARSEAPPYDRMPTYHADLQAAGFPAEVITFACAIRKANGILLSCRRNTAMDFVTPQAIT